MRDDQHLDERPGRGLCAPALGSRPGRSPLLPGLPARAGDRNRPRGGRRGRHRGSCEAALPGRGQVRDRARPRAHRGRDRQGRPHVDPCGAQRAQGDGRLDAPQPRGVHQSSSKAAPRPISQGDGVRHRRCAALRGRAGGLGPARQGGLAADGARPRRAARRSRAPSR